jgi:hypothetical protein
MESYKSKNSAPSPHCHWRTLHSTNWRNLAVSFDSSLASLAKQVMSASASLTGGLLHKSQKHSFAAA